MVWVLEDIGLIMQRETANHVTMVEHTVKLNANLAVVAQPKDGSVLNILITHTKGNNING